MKQARLKGAATKKPMDGADSLLPGRRKWLGSLGMAAAGSAMLLVPKLGKAKEAATAEGGVTALIKQKEGDDILIRMQNDIVRALARPIESRRWAMLIDLRKCVGCHACTIACKAENVLPPGVVYRRVIETESGTYPQLRRDFVPVLCNHCEKPSCVNACPVNATSRRLDGIVEMDYDKCIGCRACLNACPYGARSSDFGEYYTAQTPKLQNYETRPSFEYRTARPRKPGQSPIGNARKCHFCTQRIARGQLPACVSTCIGKATIFGDIHDPSSLLVETLKSEKTQGLKPSLGLDPHVFYIGLEGVAL